MVRGDFGREVSVAHANAERSFEKFRGASTTKSDALPETLGGSAPLSPRCCHHFGLFGFALGYCQGTAVEKEDGAQPQSDQADSARLWHSLRLRINKIVHRDNIDPAREG